ncbi:MAG: hypothetical protein M0P31_18900 [Solirubrobacteraceae bacterium]|nr:hypothetical protein [Solirubrobacteraceae bacterium]
MSTTDPSPDADEREGRTIHVRLTDAEYATLVERASANHRTVAGQVRRDLATAVGALVQDATRTEVPA